MKRGAENTNSLAVWFRLTSLLLLFVFFLPMRLRAEGDEDGAAAAESEAVDQQPDEPAVKKSSSKPRTGMRLRVEYDYRKQGDDTDNDLNTRLYAHSYDLFEKKLDVYVSMRLYKDLDEPKTLSFGDDPFISTSDSDGVTDDRLLQAYADFHNPEKTLSLRAGRQYVEIADYLQLDGAQLKVNEQGEFGGRVYAGHPVSYYTGVSKDYAGGVSFVSRPWENNISRITIARYHDDSENDSDDHYYLDLRQRFSETTRARTQCSYLNDAFRMGRLDLYSYSEDGVTDLAIGVSYWGKFDANTRAYSPLYDILGEQEPYTYTYVRLTRQIADHWYISPGASIRIVDEADASNENRDYEKYNLALSYEPNRSFSTSLSFDYWAVDEGDSFSGLSGDVRYRRGRDWEIRAGASYAQYDYNSYSDLDYVVNNGQVVFSENGTVIEESPYVYTYFARIKWRITKKLIFRLQGDMEDDDTDDDIAYRVRGSVEVRL